MKNGKLTKSIMAVVALALLVIPAAANASDWDWTLSPYVWFAGGTVDAKVNDREIIDDEVNFKDLLDDTDGAIMVHLEGRTNKSGVFLDFVTIDLGDEPRFFGPMGNIEAESDLEVTILELGGLYYPGGEGRGFGIHVGGRMLDFDQEIDILSVGGIGADRRVVDFSSTLFDVLIGLRYDTGLTDGWSFALWGDVAGGDTELTWNVGAVFGYSFGARDQFAIRFGYRHMDIEIEEKADLAKLTAEMSLSGPLLGFTFIF